MYDAALLVSVIGLRSDYVISDTDVLFSGKQTKILTVRTGCRGQECDKQQIALQQLINIHNEDIYIHSVRSTEDRKQPWSMVHSSACEIK